MSIIYFVDTSELINLNNRYPRKTFPGLWENVEDLISQGRMLAPNGVRDEIKQGHDER